MQPRANEAGGRYGRGIVTRKYTKGQVIKVGISLFSPYASPLLYSSPSPPRCGSNSRPTTWATLSSASAQTTTRQRQPPKLVWIGGQTPPPPLLLPLLLPNFPSPPLPLRYPLEQAGGSGTSYYPGPGNRVFETQYRLPKDLTCAQCVFQWRYIAANNWGENNTSQGSLLCSYVAVVNKQSIRQSGVMQLWCGGEWSSQRQGL